MTSIEILGLREYDKTIQLKNNVMQALSALDLNLQLAEVTDLDALMKSDIDAIPALRVNGKIVVQQIVPGVEELKAILKALLYPTKTPSNMKKILVPTDFSQTARGAYFYALEFAQNSGAGIKLVHCFLPEVDPAFPYLSANSEAFLESKNHLLQQFKQHTMPPNEGGLATTVKVETELLRGFASEEIIRQSKLPEVDLIVMGTTGEGGFLNKLFGSVSTQVAQKAHCPILLVPNGVHYKPFRTILFASDKTVDQPMLQHVVHFASLFNANIHFVHVQKEAETDDGLKVEDQIFDALFQDGAPTFAFTMATVQAHSVVEGLNNYIAKNDIDLTVLVAPHRSFWESMLHKSVTKAMAHYTRVPMLVYH